MNRYPLWKYILIGIVLIIGLVYTLPNFYGESPAVQVTSGKATVKVTEQTLSQVETALANANLKPNGLFFEQGAHIYELPINDRLDTGHNKVNIVTVYTDKEKTKTIKVIGTYLNETITGVTIPDMYATFSYFSTFPFGIGDTDDIDSHAGVISGTVEPGREDVLRIGRFILQKPAFALQGGEHVHE